jgi:hypothetical protein
MGEVGMGLVRQTADGEIWPLDVFADASRYQLRFRGAIVQGRGTVR